VTTVRKGGASGRTTPKKTVVKKTVIKRKVIRRGGAGYDSDGEDYLDPVIV